LKVLVVDDEEEFLLTLTQRLRLRGIETQTALDGEEGLRLLEMDQPDVVILDVLMPGLGGLEVLQRIKLLEPGVPVILLTGKGTSKEGIEGMRLGAFDYLMKPVDVDELIQKIREAIMPHNVSF